jgi:hypothetical protein
MFPRCITTVKEAPRDCYAGGDFGLDGSNLK